MANDFKGSLYINQEGQLSTYSAVVADYNPYTTATDMFALQNPANSGVICKVTFCKISGTANTTTGMDIYAYIRSTLNTGGTTTAINDALHDTTNPVSAANTFSYSAAPSALGTGILVRADRMILPGNSPNVALTPIQWEFATRGGSQAIHIRPGQAFCINNAGNAVAAGTNLYFTVEWQEMAVYT